eukprot:TRINITY_DN1435_c0_g2_i1.p1 TRINITY_DN1435_c0_g2~~TRINITY_DN1435_c0_g2_i1.p1  ORF type:complete len:572 (-),score=90.39 TRINITY_DN1435_c0_g2_i1:428-2143(-)
MEQVVSGSLCPLPYPDRYNVAVLFAKAKYNSLDQETQLLLYALEQQANNGPNTQPKPWAWNQVEQAKWQAWKELGDTSMIEAMRLYVKSIEMIDSQWWQNIDQENEKEEDQEQKGASVSEVQPLNTWTAVSNGEKRPFARYEHGCCIVGANMFVVGGNSLGGKYLNDVWVLNLDDLSWLCASQVSKNMSLPPPPLPPVAGHCVIGWGANLLVIGGHRKSKDRVDELQIHVFDSSSFTWSLLTPQADNQVPEARGGHTAVLVGSSIVLFGGENGSKRKTLNDVWMLNLDSMKWSKCETKGKAPSARSEHIAVSYLNRYMLIYGGGSVAHCFNDLFVLDTQNMEWLEVQISGSTPAARAGHAGGLLGHMWYIVGGGNNISGCTDMIALDLSSLNERRVVWQTITTVESPSSLASEGLSLLSHQTSNSLISFGGYNGVYHNDVSVFKVGQSERQVIDENQDVSQSQIQNGKIELQEALTQAQARLEGNEQEISLLRKQLASAQVKSQEAELLVGKYKKELQEQQQKIMHLEVQVAELQKLMSTQQDSLKELERYQQLEENSKKSTGVWGYITGS